MTAATIAIVDACSGNLRSVERALAQAGGRAAITRDPEVVRKADKIVVPGQGAFGVFMRGLVERDLGGALREAIASGRPYLGICLGLQVLFERSEEAGATAATCVTGAARDTGAAGATAATGVTGAPVAGLGVLAGQVVRLRPGSPSLKVPHMGWNALRFRGRAPEPLLAGVPEGAHVYFVHSYHAVPADPALVCVDADHGGPITAAVRRDNLFACQFHPEKSQGVGLQILRNFVEAA